MRRMILPMLLAVAALSGCDPQSQVTERETKEFTSLPSGGLFFSTEPQGIETLFQPSDNDGNKGTFQWTENGQDKGGSYEVTGEGKMTLNFADGTKEATFTRSGLEMTITMDGQTTKFGMQ